MSVKRAASTLQQQLHQLERSNTLDLKSKKESHGVSIIYEAAEAQGQAFTTIFETCRVGFEELCRLDHRFQQYRHTLFSTGSATFEREGLDAKKREKLRRRIQAALSLLCPWLQLRSGQLALEWLVRRYNVHTEEPQDLLLATLPHHDTALFPTIITIIPDRAVPATFHFTRQLKRRPLPVQRNFLVQQCLKSPVLLELLSSHTMHATSQGTSSGLLLGFWSELFTQVLHAALESEVGEGRDKHSGKQGRILDALYDTLLSALELDHVNDDSKSKPFASPSCYPMLLVVAVKGYPTQQKIQALISFVKDSLVVTNSYDLNNGIRLCGLLARLDSQLLINPLTLDLHTTFGEQPLKRLADIHHEIDLADLALAICRSALATLKSHSTSHDLCLEALNWWLKAGLLSDRQILYIMRLCLSLLSDGQNVSVGSSRVSFENKAGTSSLQQLVLEWIQDTTFQPYLSQTYNGLSIRDRLDLPEMLSGLDAGSSQDKTQSVTRGPDQQHAKSSLTDMSVPTTVSILEGPSTCIASRPALAALDHCLSGTPQKTHLRLQQDDLKLSYLIATPSLRFHDIVSQLQKGLRFDFGPAGAQSGVLAEPTSTAIVLSLLARATLPDQASPSARYGALEGMLQLLQLVNKESLDPQSLLPWILVALSDNDTGIRSLALKTLSALSAFYVTELQTESPRKRKTLADLGFFQTSMPASHHLKNEFTRYVVDDILVPQASGAQHDATYVHRLVHHVLKSTADLATSNMGSSFDAELEPMTVAQKNSFALFLASHAVSSDLIRFQGSITKLLPTSSRLVREIHSEKLLPLVRAWVALPFSTARGHAERLHISLKDLDQAYLDILPGDGDDACSLVQQFLQADHLESRQDLLEPGFRRVRDLYCRQPIPLRMLEVIFAAATDSISGDSEFAAHRRAEARKTVRVISIAPEHLQSLLLDLPSLGAAAVLGSETRPSKRRKLTSAKDNSNPDVTMVLNRYALAIELVDHASSKSGDYLRHLFRVLQEMVRNDSKLHSSNSKLVLDLLHCLGKIYKEAHKNTVAMKFRLLVRTDCQVDLLVDCIRSSMDTAVKNEALSFLASLAEWAPEPVVEGAIPVFKYIARSTVRITEPHASRLALRAIDSILPPLVQSIHNSKDTSSAMASVLKIVDCFIVTWPETPRDHRLVIFQHLIAAAGQLDIMPLTFALLTDRYGSELDVTSFLCHLATPLATNEKAKVLDQCVTLAAGLLHVQMVEDVSDELDLIYDLSSRSMPQRAVAAENLMRVVSEFAEHKSHRAMPNKERGTLPNHEQHDIDPWHHLLARSITFKVSESKQHSGENTAIIKSIQAVLDSAPRHALLEYANSTVPDSSVSTEHRRATICGIVADQRGPSNGKTAFSSTEIELLQNLMECLSRSIDSSLLRTSIKYIDWCLHQRQEWDSTFYHNALDLSTHQLSQLYDEMDDQVSAIYTLSNIAKSMKEDILSKLPSILHEIEAAFDRNQTAANRGQMTRAIMHLYGVILPHVGFAVPPRFLQALLHKCYDDATIDTADHKGDRRSLYSTIGQSLNIDMCFDIIQESVSCAARYSLQACLELVDLVGYAFRSERSAITASEDALVGIVYSLWDIRRRLREVGSVKAVSLSEEDCNNLDTRIRKLLIKALPKVSAESPGRIIRAMVTWVAGLGAGDISGGSRARATGFFAFASSFVTKADDPQTFVGDIVQLVIHVLGSKAAERSESNLMETALSTLCACFEVGSAEDWSDAARFQALASTLFELVSHLSTNPHTTHSLLQQSETTIAQFARTIEGTQRRAIINNATIVLIQDEDARIRRCGVRIQLQLLQVCSQSWLLLLPQLLPHISALQEDDDEQVEALTKLWIAQLSELRGESVMSMLV